MASNKMLTVTRRKELVVSLYSKIAVCEKTDHEQIMRRRKHNVRCGYEGRRVAASKLFRDCDWRTRSGDDINI